MKYVVRRGKHLTLIDVIDFNRLQYLCFGKWPIRTLAITGIETASWIL